MRERIGALLRSTLGKVLAVLFLAGGVAAATQLIGNGDADVTAAAEGGVPGSDDVAETAEEAMNIATRRPGLGLEAPPGEECRKMTVGEIRAASQADSRFHGATFVDGAPDDLQVWVCPVLDPPNGRGLTYVAAEPSDFEIGGGSILRVTPPTDEPSEAGSSTTKPLPPLNEVQTPPVEP